MGRQSLADPIDSALSTLNAAYMRKFRQPPDLTACRQMQQCAQRVLDGEEFQWVGGRGELRRVRFGKP